MGGEGFRRKSEPDLTQRILDLRSVSVDHIEFRLLMATEDPTRRFLFVGTLGGGLLLCVLNWFTAAILPPRFKQFRDPQAVTEAVAVNVSDNDIYVAPQGLFVSVSLSSKARGPSPRFAARLVAQLLIEFTVAFGVSLLLLVIPVSSPLWAAGSAGFAGFIAGLETHFPLWNWEGFPFSYLLAGCFYLAASWFLVGLTLDSLFRSMISRNGANVQKYDG